jgi:hypothetical protein
MGSANVSKIERVSSSKNRTLWVDLCLDKQEGNFFADVGGERITDKTKDGAVKKVVAALDRVTGVVWREVILIRVEKAREVDEDDDEGDDRVTGRENDLLVFGSSCRFTYLRRERAAHPLRSKEVVQREHREDFESRVTRRRKEEARFGHDKAEKKRRADEEEQRLRDRRAALVTIGSVWEQGERTTECELPYSDEAWHGIQLIAQALRTTQAQLNAFVAVEPEGLTARLTALATENVLRQLGPAPEASKVLRQLGPAPEKRKA